MIPLLEINNLSISFDHEGDKSIAVSEISFDVLKGETLGIVGESGSGKSVSCLSIMKLLSTPPASITCDSILYQFNEKRINLFDLDHNGIRKIRGAEIAMIFQDPMSSLNPTHRCGNQVLEAILLHTDLDKIQGKQKVLDLFKKVLLPDPERIYQSYPHELSGGQIQRIMIAMALSCNPKILIADEPTTALDVTVQKAIIDLLKQLQIEMNMTILFISHDLGVVQEIADRVIVMRKGAIVEKGNVDSIFTNPKHPYTKGLIACRPPLDRKLNRLPTIEMFENEQVDIEAFKGEYSLSSYKDRIEKARVILKVSHLNTWYTIKKNWFGRPTEYMKAVKDADLVIREGEVVGLVGESGSGKSSLGMTILNLIERQSGDVEFFGRNIFDLSRGEMKKMRKDIQIIFQNPYASLNPRMKIGEAILEPMTVHNIGVSRKKRKKRVFELLEKVGLKADHFDRYPHEFSGGQRQRISIARTLAVEPKFIVCDESVSALDVSVQAQILNLLKDIKDELGLSYLFISHDLSVVKFMSDRILVMKNGEIVERGLSNDVYTNPQEEYTRSLIDAIPKFK